MGDCSLQLWSQSDWIIFLGSQGPTVHEIIRCLGLSHTDNRGALKFSEPESRRLSIEVQKLSQTLPTDMDALLRSVSDPNVLNEALNTLLNNHGPGIWGEKAERKRLLIPAGTSDTSYSKELFFEVPADRTILKIHLYRWIYKKAYASLQPRMTTRQSAASNVTTNFGGSAAHAVADRPAPFTIESTISHATDRDTAKRKVRPSLNNLNATKRHRQNAATPVEPTLRRSASTSRGSSEHNRHTPSPLDVPTLAATPSTRAPVILGPPFHHAQGDTHTNTFVAVNQTSTNTHTAPSSSVLSVAPNIPSSLRQLRASSFSNDQRRERHDTGRVQSSHSSTPPTNPANLSQNDAFRVLPSSLTRTPDPHHLMSHDTDQQYSPRSNEMAGSREVSFEQCDLLSLLLNYLFPRESAHVEESIMLRSLEQVWTSHEQDFRLIMEQRSNDHQRALHIWIGQRRKTSQLQMMIDRQPSAQTLEMVDRVLVMNDIRILQLKWKALRVHGHNQDSTPEDLLCSTFAIMTRTQGTEALFKEGLQRLKETSPEVWSCDAPIISIYSQ